jgi:DNA-binding phage protein
MTTRTYQVSAVARSAGMSAAHLDQILTGRRVPRLDTLSKVLIAIPASPEELFCGKGEGK